ncbi:MAG TPA: hypothetical protein VFZ18_09120 [Longimicrobiaceae bacterium]
MSWAIPALLGAYHGLNPAMGWLFAVALGLQRRRASGVLMALPPIALGHAASVAVAIVVVGAGGWLLPAGLLRVMGAAVLFAFGGWLLLRRGRHPRWVGMRLGFRDLALWSFVMSSAHGAGLMLLPVLVGGAAAHPHAHGGFDPAVQYGLIAAVSHTAAMFLVMSAMALLTYRVLGLSFLRRAWINFDLFWTGAIFAAGVVTLLVH